MNKKLLMIFTLLTILLVPFMSAHAESYTIHNQADLKSALQNNDIDTIILGEDIETTEKINITRNVTIDGANHTIKYVGTFGADGSKNNTVWGGIYVLQFYKTTGTLKDIKLTGGNAGLLINGSNVTFVGNIDVSGNGFGGIELGQGSGVTEKNTLALENATITNTSETEDHPSIWVPDDSAAAEMIINGESKQIDPGHELTMTEVNELFGINIPQTYDNINLIMTFFTLSLVSIVMGVKLYKKEF